MTAVKRIGTWNVNSIRARISHLLQVLKSGEYHTLLIQEAKCSNQDFTNVRPAIEDLGYNVAYHGQKSYNGVATLSKSIIQKVSTEVHGNDEQARYIETIINGLVVINIYLPNGNPINSPKFVYKLSWMDSLISRIRTILEDSSSKLFLGGDFNVAPTDLDCHDPAIYKDDAVTQEESREKFRSLLALGLTDVVRQLNQGKAIYTYWGYRGFAWQKNAGLRLDHILLSKNTLQLLNTAGIETSVRGMEKASDHCIAWAEIDF